MKWRLLLASLLALAATLAVFATAFAASTESILD
jgi:hypothetical protein